jgi:hypothetical protein
MPARIALPDSGGARFRCLPGSKIVRHVLTALVVVGLGGAALVYHERAEDLRASRAAIAAEAQADALNAQTEAQAQTLREKAYDECMRDLRIYDLNNQPFNTNEHSVLCSYR